jgi:hypothetical protein
MLEEAQEIWLGSVIPCPRRRISRTLRSPFTLRDLSPHSNPMRVQPAIVQRESAAASARLSIAVPISS